MSFSGGNPEGGSKISAHSSQMTYQWDESVVGVNIECRLDDDMARFFAHANLSI